MRLARWLTVCDKRRGPLNRRSLASRLLLRARSLNRRIRSAAAAALEQDARALNVIPLFRSTDFDGAQLLPAFWSLPYDERLAACLIVVEEFDPALASATSNIPPGMLAARANRAMARLSGALPHRTRTGTR